MRRSLLGSLVMLACAGTTAGGGDEESSGGPIDFPAPDFVEPAGAELHLELSRDIDLDLDLSGVEPGRTVLSIDGVSVGPMIGVSALGAIKGERLLLYLRGGMVPGQHGIQLTTFDDVASESSEVVQVFLESVAPPSIGWEASGDPLGEGDALVPAGPGDRGVLGLVDFTGAEPRVSLWPVHARGWDRTQLRALTLPGLRARPGERTAAVAVLRDGPHVRVAWRVDVPGTSIAAVEVPWDSSADGTPTTVLAPDPHWLGAREWVDVVRPVLAGDLVLAELTAPGDAEQPRPGDRVVASAVIAALEHPGAPQLVQLGAVDLDQLAYVVDPLVGATGTSDTLLVRRDHREPVVLDVDRSSRTIHRRGSDADARDERWTAMFGAPVATAAAFGSRIVAGIADGGATLTVGMLSDRGAADPLVVELALEPAAVGDPALAWIDGVPIVLVPRGDADVLAVPITSVKPQPQALAGLACDAVVGPPVVGTTDESRGELACLRARTLAVVVLRVE